MIGSVQLGLGSVPTAGETEGTAGPGAGVTTVNGAPGAVTTSVEPGLTQTVSGTNTTFGQTMTAEWPIGLATRRFFAVDFVAGNDANAGFSDVSMAAAGLVAKKTFAGLRAVFPPTGAGRSAEIAIANGGVNTIQAYAEGIDSFLQNCGGYAANSPIIRGTGTNPTAGATKFAGNVADATYVGAITVPGLNVPGYNPTAASTTTVITALQVGGAAPAFPAEPLAPLGWRVRFDAATATVALRNVCRCIVSVTTNTLGMLTALPAVPAVADVFYIEQAGISVATTVLTGAPNNQAFATNSIGMQFAGIQFGSLVMRNTGAQFALCGLSLTPALSDSNNESAQLYVHPLGTLTIGGALHCTVGFSSNNGGGARLFGACVETFAVISNARRIQVSASTFGVLLDVEGGAPCDNASVIGSAGAVPLTRILGSDVGVGAGLFINQSNVRLGNIQLTGAGARPAVRFGPNAQIVQQGGTSLSGATGNNDVGLEMQGPSARYDMSAVVNTLTGALGNVRLPSGLLPTWANLILSGLADSKANRFVGTTGPLALSRFTGQLVSGVAPVLSYCADAQLPVANNLLQLRYPMSQRTLIRLWLCVRQGAIGVPVTLTAFRNGVATTMTLVMPAGSAVGTKVMTAVNPVLFVDGDDHDFQISAPIDAVLPGSIHLSGGFEYAV